MSINVTKTFYSQDGIQSLTVTLSLDFGPNRPVDKKSPVFDSVFQDLEEKLAKLGFLSPPSTTFDHIDL